MKQLLLVISMLIFLDFFPISSKAQCAMCRATVEKSESEAAAFNKRAKGLNNGILYLMAIPYILGGVIAYYWYQNSKKERDRKIQVQRILKSKLS